MCVLFEFISTLKRLDVIEADRDRWQRPSDVLKALDLHETEVAVDLGSGAGYFALKLSPLVGQRGEVIAVDIRRLSMFFLRIRAILRNQHNLRIIVGDDDNPRLTGLPKKRVRHPVCRLCPTKICVTARAISFSW